MRKSIRNSIFLSLSLCLIFLSCKEQRKTESTEPTESEITGLATPVILNYGSTIVFTADYFNNIDRIDSLAGHSNLKIELSSNKQEIEINPVGNQIPVLSEA